ncbi:Centrosomal protein [Merluccius polli]|uniref:Centrosomal protein n=1 Tax=Merluccius polli TaxID=89951 RepID=A0AA47NQZ6_MERPO|nr:Centrosomal protein [Merluccius polli]
MQAVAVDSSPARQVDRLVLHHSSPSHSLSSPSHSGRDAGPCPKAEGLSTSLALQRPETSRGRLARATNTQQREVESPTRELGGPPAEELSWKTQRTLRGEGTSGEAVEEEEVKIGELRKKEEREEERRRKMEEEEWGKEVKERERHHEETEMERRNVDREVEEEKKRASLEKERRLCLLQEELRREEEEEERRLKQESEERVRAVCQRLDCERSEEETRLREESNRKLKELRESGQRERENQHRVLREEGEATINDLRATLDEEHAAERDRLEARRRLDLENLKVELEAEIQAERRRLLGEKEEKLSSLRQEIKSTERKKELMSPRPVQQLAEYHRELADVLQEVREEVQRDHDRKLEQLKEEHRRELNTIREKHLDEESAQRERLLCALQDDRERLQSTHTVQLEKLRLELDAQTQRTRLAHTRRECELQEQLEQLEVKTKDLKTQEVLLQTKAADLKRRRKRLGEEEEEVDRGIEIEQLKEELGRAREEKRRAQREADGARGERDTAREESRRAQEERDRLELKVEVLQERCARLSRSEPEQGDRAGVSLRPQPRQEKKKAEKRVEEAEEPAAPSSDGKMGSLHMDDLEDPPLSPTPDSQSSLDDMHCYISTEEASVHKARQFLERESQRQAVLQAAGPVPFASNRSLDAAAQEARQLDLRRALQQGSVLLQQLESSMAQEPLLEELSRMAAERKVTFDVTDSDLSSTLDPQDGPGDHPTVPAKIQQLSESLQQISGQLNMVLGALGSLGQPSASTATQASGGVPPTSSSPLSAGPPWAWGAGTHRASGATPLFATPIAGTRRASGDLLNSRWAKLFPGAPVDPVASSTLRTGSAYSSFTPASESARSLHSMPKTFEMDGQRLQGLIDGNKRWLEMRRKDASMYPFFSFQCKETPLFTRYRPPAAGGTGLVQLGLDDNNQIKVYHY